MTGKRKMLRGYGLGAPIEHGLQTLWGDQNTPSVTVLRGSSLGQTNVKVSDLGVPNLLLYIASSEQPLRFTRYCWAS